MAKPRNDELRNSIRFRRAELLLENPLTTPGEITRILAEEFKVKPRTVWYYLRINETKDARIRYTETEKRRLMLMTRQQLKRYCEDSNLNFSTLYAMVWRERVKDQRKAESQASNISSLEAIGYMDFSKAADLRAVGVNKSMVKDAKAFLQSLQGLDLMAPCYLVHPPSKKFYALSLSEQKAILEDPRRFIQHRAPHISANWKKYANAEHYFVLLNTARASRQYEGEVISTHDIFERAAEAQHELKDRIPTKILRVMGISHSSVTRYVPGERVPTAETKNLCGQSPTATTTTSTIPTTLASPAPTPAYEDDGCGGWDPDEETV